MSIVHVNKQKNFSIISNIPLNDSTLSLKAKGLWAYLMSKPDSWKVSVSHLVKTCKDGRDSIYSCLKELKIAGYVELIENRENGKFLSYDYIVNEEPQRKVKNDIADLPFTAFPLAEKPLTEKPTLLNTDRIQYSLKQKLKKTTTTTSPSIIPSNGDKTAVAAVVSNLDLNNQNNIVPVHSSKELSNTVPDNLISKNNLDELFGLVLTKHQQPLINKFIQDKLKSCIPFDTLKAAILYSNTKSSGDTSQFRSFLGKTISNNWHSGFLEQLEIEQMQKQEFENLQALKKLAEQQKILEQRKKDLEAKRESDEMDAILKTIDLQELDTFIESKNVWSNINSFERARWKKNERWITRRINLKAFLKNKFLKST